MSHIARILDHDGYTMIPGVLDAAVLEGLSREIEEQLPRIVSAGVRGICAKAPGVGRLGASPSIRALIEPVLGSEARLVRSIFFNKSQDLNWQVAWHQDLTIAVRERAEVEGYVAWSSKDGVPHVQPPLDVLERMLSVRLHLDAADESNGALWVSPGSHRLGRLSAEEAAAAAERFGKRACSVNAGDALLFRPLLLHSSRKQTSNRPRRVIHLEFCAASLPEPLIWAETP